MSTAGQQSATAPSPPFERILCVTGLAPGGAEAARQAEVLGGLGATIETIDEAVGVPQRCADYDLVVVPAGEAAFEVLSSAPITVLVTRAPSRSSGFLESMLVAVDGTAEAHAAALLGAKIAAGSGALVTLVASPEHDAAHQHALQDDVRAVEQVTGTRPLVLDEHRGPVPSILTAAAEMEASLIVIGRRPGHPMTRVSTEVATWADCSVLVVRARPPLSSPGASP